MNTLINWVSVVPGGVIRQFPCSFWQAMAMLVLVIAIGSYWQRPSRTRRKLLLFLWLLIPLVGIAEALQLAYSNELVVFQLPKQTLLAQRSGFKAQVYHLPNKNPTLIANALSDYKRVCQGLTCKVHLLPRGLLQHKQAILIADSKQCDSAKTTVYGIILVQSTRLHLDRLLEKYRPTWVVADGSNTKRMLPLWEQSCRRYGVLFWNTQQKGAFKLAH